MLIMNVLFYKQKTAYELRISDWSSDVCSSDLVTATMILDGNGITKNWVSLDQIDPDMPRAAIGAKDSRFCSHHGFDADAIENAFIRNMRGGKSRGGSTLSQQPAQNAFLWQNGGFFRTGTAAWFTILIEHIRGKKRLMESHPNVDEKKRKSVWEEK